MMDTDEDLRVKWVVRKISWQISPNALLCQQRKWIF